MAKDVGKGSDMQGTPPRDLTVLGILLLCSHMCVWVCLCAPVWVKEIALVQIACILINMSE